MTLILTPTRRNLGVPHVVNSLLQAARPRTRSIASISKILIAKRGVYAEANIG